MKKSITISCLALLLSGFNYLYGQVIDSISYNLDTFIFIENRAMDKEVIAFSNRDFKKLAASFDDPSRLLMHKVGFTPSGDQANAISYHGLPSNLFSWQVNGSDVVNPNHLANAGTGSDLSTLAAGGVNAFSGNIINRLTFHSMSDHKAVNAITMAGVMDLKVDTLERSYAQFSLLGLESGIRLKQKNVSAFVNYRYSFTGLLADFGVDFGGEQIRFQDLAIGVHYKGNKSKTTLLYLTGKNGNLHQALDSVSSPKDGLRIDYQSKLSLINFDYNQYNVKGHTLKITSAYSFRDDSRLSDGSVLMFNKNYKVNDAFFYSENKWSSTIKFSKNSDLYHVGIKFITHKLGFDNKTTFFSHVRDTSFNSAILFVGTKIPIVKNLNAYLDLSLIKDKNYYPLGLAKIEYETAFGNLSLILNNTFQQLNQSNTTSNKGSKMKNLMLQYGIVKGAFQISASAFYHKIDRNLISENTKYLFAGVDYNYIESYDSSASFALYGSSLNVSFLSNWIWANGNLSLIKSTVRLETNPEYVINLSCGKDFWIHQNKLSIATSISHAGKQYRYQIKGENHLNERDYTRDLKSISNGYIRLDARINYYLKKSFISLDIQNLTGSNNVQYYGYTVSEVKPQGGLGILPVLTWKRFF